VKNSLNLLPKVGLATCSAANGIKFAEFSKNLKFQAAVDYAQFTLCLKALPGV